MKKILGTCIALFLGVVMMFGVVGCNADTQKELQNTIDELQSRIEEMEDRLAEMEEQIRERDEKIEQLENEIAEKSVGTFYSLQEAYDYGYLTKTDLESVANYLNEEIEYSEALDGEIENAIKEAAAYEIRNRKIEPFPEATAEGFRLTAFYGAYSDSYVIKMRNDYDNLPTDVPNYWEEIGGVQFHFMGHDRVTVWREKE